MSRQVSGVSRREKHGATLAIKQSRVRGMIYAGSSGCRVVVLIHKLG